MKKEMNEKTMVLAHLRQKHNHTLTFLACLIWLVLRSGRKPTRLAYPCQQMAAITVSTYLGVIFIFFRRQIVSLVKEKILPRLTAGNTVILLLSAVILLTAIPHYQAIRSFKKYDSAKSSSAMGTPAYRQDKKSALIYQSIPAAMLLENPHRVVSVHDSSATSWAGSGNPHNYINEIEVAKMVKEGVLKLTKETDYVNAWKKLIPYKQGEIVAIKLNLNNWGDLSATMNPYTELVNAVIGGLIAMGVPANNIWLIDPSRGMSSAWTAKIKPQGIKFNPYANQYVDANSPYASIVNFTREGATAVRPGSAFIEADHIINMPQLKGHGGASITLSLKNHYGSAEIGTQGREHWHDYIYQHNSGYGNNGINPLIAINLNPVFVEKTRLIIGDGLYGHPTLNYAAPVLFRSFGNNPPEILFFGVDPVAVDSVMFDYLQRECRASGQPARNDDLNREAALAGLGVNEHWNSDTTRKYNAIEYAEVDLDQVIPPGIKYGDVSGDNEITAYDAALTAQNAISLITFTAEQATKADVSGDGQITAYDAALIAQYAVGIIDHFPVEN